MNEWLDTETRAILSKSPPVKQTERDTESYSLILTRRGPDGSRIDDAITEIQEDADVPKIQREHPRIIAHRLTLDDALAGQIALACCHCVSIIIRDAVADNDDRSYLREIYSDAANSKEFDRVDVVILSVPST